MDIITCPNCGEYVIINELNCGIFRHAAYISTGEQVDPHLPQKDCEELVASGKVVGCCKPFRVKVIDDVWTAEICEYI